MTEIEILILFLATVFGAITTSTLGWLDSKTPFDARAFIPGLMRGIIAAALVFAAQYSGFIGEVNFFTYLGSFFAGGGFDAMGNHVSGIIQSKPTPTTSTTATTPTTNIYRLKICLIFLLRLIFVIPTKK